jgi:two-component system nitrogen regulation sensor histidine kinase NtrY
MKNKYLDQIDKKDKSNFEENLKIINNQIKQIGNLVNEFSDFARMPKPILKVNNLNTIIRDNVNLLKELDETIEIEFISSEKDIFLKSDNEQLSRVFLNLIKNSVESIQEKKHNNPDYRGKILIELINSATYIDFFIIDNGIGFGLLKDNIKNILNPYFTTKKKGTGLGLAIVNKIINDHNGFLYFSSLDDGAKIEIKFNK